MAKRLLRIPGYKELRYTQLLSSDREKQADETPKSFEASMERVLKILCQLTKR